MKIVDLAFASLPSPLPTLVTLTTDPPRPTPRIRVEARHGGVTVRVETAEATTTFDTTTGATGRQLRVGELVGEHVAAAVAERALTQGFSRVYVASSRGRVYAYAVSMYTESSRSLTGVVEARTLHTSLVAEHRQAIAQAVDASLVALIGP